MPPTPRSVAVAQSGLTAADLATLDQVRALTTLPGQIQVQRTPDGGFFVDLQRHRQAVLLARTDAQGRVVTRCVDSVEAATAFLSGSAALSAQVVGPEDAAIGRVVAASRMAAPAASHTTIMINVLDAPGVGFNDPTPATPVGGNTGITVGAQRMIVFQHVANIWAAYLQSTVPISIDASFAPTDCTILGSAGPQAAFHDFTPSGNSPGPEHGNTWYVEALANKRAGHDLSPATSDISASFNGAIGTASCPGGGAWYYGLDSLGPVGSADLQATILHEFGHGFGFLSLVGSSAGSYGVNFAGIDDIWNYFLYDDSTGKHFKDMTVGERSRAITNTNALVWDGPALTAAARGYLAAPAVLTITTPLAISGQYDATTAPFGAQVGSSPLSGALAAAIDVDEDGAGTNFTSTDACSPLTNAAAVAGKIALIDRGGCLMVVKVKHAQDAGAIGAVIANNVAGGPPAISGSDPAISIAAIGIAQADGAALRAALGTGTVSAKIGHDRTRLAGADSAGRVRMFAPNPIQYGSSISHFDTSATPNLLMEPFINPGLGQSIDLTGDLLRDIGWFPDINYNGVADANEVDLSITQAAAPITKLSVGGTVAITLTITSSGFLNTSAAHIVDSFPAQFGAITWTDSYSGGASGPASGTGNIDSTLAMPSGSTVTYVISATVVGESLAITNTASVASIGAEIDGNAANNQASVAFSLAAETIFLPLIAR
jgi:hypothetical protein